MKTNKIILVRHRRSGKYGHAVHQDRAGIGCSYEVRLLESYENVHTCNVPSFYIYYEVLDDDVESG